MSFALATIRHDGRPTPVIEAHGQHYALSTVAPELLEPAPSRGLMNIFERWDTAEEELVQLCERLREARSNSVPDPSSETT